MKAYTVWTGQKFKGSWTDKNLAVGYMAARVESERKAWSLVEVDISDPFDDEIEEAAKALKVSKLSGGVHHLKAKSIEASSKGRVRSQ